MGSGIGRIKLAGLVVVAVLAFGSLAASSASARSWWVEGSSLSGAQEVGCSGSLEFVGDIYGVEVTLSGFAECQQAEIFNAWGIGEGTATVAMYGVTVTPGYLGCEVPGGSLTTRTLRSKLIEVSGSGHLFEEFVPWAGTELALVELAECVLAGEYPIEGSIPARGPEWGTESSTQNLTFGIGVETETGLGPMFAGYPAELSGSIRNQLFSGAEFGGA